MCPYLRGRLINHKGEGLDEAVVVCGKTHYRFVVAVGKADTGDALRLIRDE